MNHYLVAVKDRAVNTFMRPFVVRTRGEALRVFEDEVKNPESPMNKHPEDYDLYYIDMFNDENGMTIDRPDRPELLARAQDLIQK